MLGGGRGEGFPSNDGEDKRSAGGDRRPPGGVGRGWVEEMGRGRGRGGSAARWGGGGGGGEGGGTATAMGVGGCSMEVKRLPEVGDDGDDR